jgi:hypothetical protein
MGYPSVSLAMALRKLYILKIEIQGDEEVCESLTEQFIYPDLSLQVEDYDLVDYFDDEAINLCWDCDEIGLT